MIGKTPANRFISICITAAFLYFAFFSSGPGWADIYRYIDSNGVMHFTNAPTRSGYKLYVREKPDPASATPTGKSLPDKYDFSIRKAALRHGLPFGLLKALIKVESDYNPRAVSKAGAMGLMQLMPENVKAFNVKDPFDPHQNIMAGSRYLTGLLSRFKGKLPLALAAYNAGPSVVERYQQIPPFKETEDYVEKVMKLYYLINR